MGWLAEVFKIREYVRDANEDPEFIKKFSEKLKIHPKPPFSTFRFIGQIMVGYLWAHVAMNAIPDTEFFGIDWSFLHWFIPLFGALGVWTVGNIGREQGTLTYCLLAAYIVYPMRYYVYDETYWGMGMIFVSAMIFDTFSKDWCRQKPKRYSLNRRTLCLSFAVCIYLSLWGCYFLFHGKVTDSDGDEIPLHEAIKHFFTSPWWTDLKQTLHDTWQFAQHNGWSEVWKQIIENMDPDGGINAFKTLGVSPTASQSEIKSAWKKLSKEFHPDKVKNSELREAAHEKFMEIQQAYELLSKIKTKRHQKNKKYTEDL